MTEPEAPTAITRKAPAKLNLSLRLTGRREDGYHEIDTLMVPLAGLHDVLTVAPASAFEFTCDDPSLPVDDGNLVVRAVRAFAEAAGVADKVRVHLQKNIPSGAGLGGGSSDAAATLLALQEMHGNPLGAEAIHELAAALGSDVPFFLYGKPARCTGRGEIVTAAPEALSESWPVLLLKPRFSVATADAYRHAMDASVPMIPGIPMGPQEVDGVMLTNDLERPVFAKHRVLAEMKLWLRERPETRGALMSGSGSTIFAVLREGVDGDVLAGAALHEIDATLWSWHGRIHV